MGFLLLELVDAVLHGAGADELVDEDGLVLADAVGAVGGLIFGSGIPPGIKMDDAVGGGEVEAGPAGFEGDEEDGNVLVLETINKAAPVLGFTSEF